MGKNSGINWTDHTWNPWQGCRKVSPGCLNCYMYRDKKRFGQDPSTVVRSKPATFNAPLKWKDPARVFVCSWSDFFIEDADPWRGEAWEIMRRTPHLTYMLLTKRPENIKERLPADWPLKNVWIGVTAEDTPNFLKRVPVLRDAAGPNVAGLFVSVEPMLRPILPTVTLTGINWVICGGESGPRPREIRYTWVNYLKSLCEFEKVPFFFKQWGPRGAGRELDGREHLELPEGF